VKTELVPAAIAALGGGSLLATILVAEHIREAKMRRSRVPMVLTFPMSTEPAQALRALGALSGLSPSVELVLEVGGVGEDIYHRVRVPESVADAVAAQLRAAIPGLRVEREDGRARAALPRPRGVSIVIPPRTTVRTEDPEGASRALLAALQPLHTGEEVVVCWTVRPGRPDRGERSDEGARAWRAKTEQPGFFAAGAVMVYAQHQARARALTARVIAVVEARRGAHGRLQVRSRARSADVPRTGRRRGWLAIPELLPILGWPLGSEAMPGVRSGASREVAPRKEMATHGRPLFTAMHHGRSRPIALSPKAATRHTLVLGKTGSGKSVLLTRGIVSDIEAGFGGVVIDLKGDLVTDVLDRVGAQHAGRIAVIDASDAGAVPGIDLFSGGDPDLRADVLLTVMRSLSKDAWGPRIDSYARLGLRTLAPARGASLTDWPALFMDASVRRAAVARLSDPLLVAQWQTFEALSAAEKVQHVAAPLSRVTAIIGRPAVRHVLGQPNPRLDIAKLLRERKWLFLACPAGVIGAPAARLIASVTTYVVWSAIAARAALPQEQRDHVSLYFDETQALTDQGIGLEDMLEQARGFNASVTIATQAAGRLPEPIRTALFSNAATLVSFAAGSDEAARVARELPGFQARDLQSLGEFEVAARVGLERGAGSAIVTGRTESPPPLAGHAELIRRRSAEQYGRDREEIEAAIRVRYGADPMPLEEPTDFGRGRRQS
jgi:hypothetical protein